MIVYVLTTNYSGWEDPEANGCNVHLFDSEEKALSAIKEKVEQSIEEEKEYGREFRRVMVLSHYVTIVSQYDEYIEFEIIPQEVK